MKIQDIYKQSKDKSLDDDSARRLLSALNAYIWTLEEKPKVGKYTGKSASNAILAYRNLYQNYPLHKAEVARQGKNIRWVIKHYTRFFNAQGVANTLNAMAKLGLSAGDLEKILLPAISRHAQYFNAQEIANTLNAMANLGLLVERLEKILLSAISRNVRHFNAQDIANTLNAMAKLGLSADGCDKILLSAITRNAQSFNAQDIANTLNAMAKLGLSVEGLEKILRSAVSRNAQYFDAQNIANTLNAMVKLRLSDLTLTSNLLERSHDMRLEGMGCLQVYHAAYWARYVWKMAVDKLPKHTIHSANECLIQSVTVSRLQSDVMSLFSGLYPGLKLEQEKLIGPTIVDGYFEINDQKVILEVYGPAHYNGSEKNQDTLDKEVLLKAMGYTVISINHKDWDDKNKGDRKAMLISLIDPLQEKSTGYVQRRR